MQAVTINRLCSDSTPADALSCMQHNVRDILEALADWTHALGTRHALQLTVQEEQAIAKTPGHCASHFAGP